MAHTPKNARILVIDDEPDVREMLEFLLEEEGFLVESAPDATSGLAKLAARDYDLLLLDLMLPDMSGMDVLKRIRKEDRELPVCMVTAHGSTSVAVEALKSGANDYFSKPFDNEKLILEIARLIDSRRLQKENTQLRRALKQRYAFPEIVGKSDKMLQVLDLVKQVASSRSTILVTGETGTGKELIAKAIHMNSARADNMFIAVNSGSLPPELLESTLFGHVRGAFTGAVASHKGYFEVADNGSIFFDEIGTINVDTQAKLLRVIQEKEFIPLGGTEAIKVDVRILAATNADLKRMVEEGKFREDLYYRLNVINIDLPPLRDRKEDIPRLVEHFFQKYCVENGKYLDPEGRSRLRFDAEAMSMLMEYNWPGNVRELENAVERAVVLASEMVAPASVLPDSLLHAHGVAVRRDERGNLAPDASLFEIMADLERNIILEQLERNGWSQTDAAEKLHIPLSTLNQKIKRLNIEVKKKSEQAKSAG
ncbi:MAG: sigma-54 dependent transcriptional regulator [Bryobacterales bacterium]|jgi:DNA-binding NtrC family response regulator|nr:sigma-54 dependent transcriptional regulator [Bryobacterales bacterium]